MATEGTPPGPTSGSSEHEEVQWSEQYADVVELATERAQQLGQMIGEFVQRRPYVAAAIGAALFGAIVGTIIADRVPRRRPPTPWERARETIRGRVGEARARVQEMRERPPRPTIRPISVVDLLPFWMRVGLRLMRNPMVRRVAVRMAFGALRGAAGRRGRAWAPGS